MMDRIPVFCPERWRQIAEITKKNTNTGATPFKAPTKMVPNSENLTAASGAYTAIKVPMIRPTQIC